MKKIVILILVSLVTSLVFTACNNDTSKPSQNPATEYKDGVYEGEGAPDERGWKSVIEITISDEKITKVVFDEVNEDGEKKTEDGYRNNLLERNNVDIIQVYESLQNDLVEKQNAKSVDVVTGATGSSSAFKELAEKTLLDAKK